MTTLLLTPAAIQKKLCLGKDTAYALFKRSDFPTLQIGRRLYIRPEALTEWMKSREKIDGDAAEYFHLLQKSGALTEDEVEKISITDMGSLLRAVRSGGMTRADVINHVKGISTKKDLSE